MTARSLVFTVVALAACNKPSEENCRKAIMNMRDLLGTQESPSGTDLSEAVRSCKGGSSKAAVECAMNAKSLDDLDKCEFMHMPDKAQACKTALEKVHALRGGGAITDDEVRRCSSFSRKSIKCASEAANAEEVDKCGFMPPPGAGSGSGSGSGSAKS